jgi:hypothetical protein
MPAICHTSLARSTVVLLVGVLLTVATLVTVSRLWGKPVDGWTYWALSVDPNRNFQARAAFQEHMSEWPGTWQRRVREFSADELEHRGICGGKWLPRTHNCGWNSTNTTSRYRAYSQRCRVSERDSTPSRILMWSAFPQHSGFRIGSAPHLTTVAGQSRFAGWLTSTSADNACPARRCAVCDFARRNCTNSSAADTCDLVKILRTSGN